MLFQSQNIINYMKIAPNKYKNFSLIFFLISLFFINSCGIYRPANVKDFPINEADKRAKNIDEGRGVKRLFGGGKKSGDFDFASSNSMWRATIQVLDFTPLANADYGGGIIITDWYSNDENSNEAIKISVQFLSNEIRADGLTVKTYKRKCKVNLGCITNEIKSDLNSEIKLAILKKASKIESGIRKKKVKESGGYKITPLKDKKKKK
jgi:hypothetical protein